MNSYLINGKRLCKIENNFSIVAILRLYPYNDFTDTNIINKSKIIEGVRVCCQKKHLLG